MAGVGEQHQGEQPDRLGVVGHRGVQPAGQADGLGRQLPALELGAGGGRVALVEDQVEHVAHDGEPLVALARATGASKRAPASVIRCLARLIRWAIVASGTRNAAAISAVVSPPTARSVSATCDGGVSAGWQHRKQQGELVVGPGRPRRAAAASSASAGRRAPSASSRRRRAAGGADLVGRAGATRPSPASRGVARARPRPATAAPPPAAPPAPRPRTRRSRRSGGRARRGPAARARAAGPRRSSAPVDITARLRAAQSSSAVPPCMSGRTSISVRSADGISAAISRARSRLSQSTT